jgi:hypothetical protein
MVRTWVIAGVNWSLRVCLYRGESLAEVFRARTSCLEICIDFRLPVDDCLLKFRRITNPPSSPKTPLSEHADLSERLHHQRNHRLVFVVISMRNALFLYDY